MNVAIVTSVSSNIADFAAATVPNKLEYCLRHGYSLIVENQPYDIAAASTHQLCDYLGRFDVVWTLDADAVITSMAAPIHSLPCLGPHVTVCEEGVVDWNGINCGSMVWKNTLRSRWLATTLAVMQPEWESLACGWQTWLDSRIKDLGGAVTVAPLRSFNSCAWTHPGGDTLRHEPGSHWRPGDFVYHPCGVFPRELKLKHVRNALQQVI